MFKAGIIGATGYAGAELLRLLLAHPHVEVAALSSVSFEGQVIADVYPAFTGACSLPLLSQDEVINQCQVIFAALPHGLSEPLARRCLSEQKLFIDLGADFRLDDADVYARWYGESYQDPALHALSVYGLCELFREDIGTSFIVGNPGCYPTATALGLAPALEADLVNPTSLIVDAKSGVTGAGRGLSQNTHFPDCNEAFAPYKIADHRHTPEMEQTLSKVAGTSVSLTFVPHLLPVNRGILATIYADLKSDPPLSQMHALYIDRYKDEPFVQVLPLGAVANLRDVKYSNCCHISLHKDEHTRRLIIVSAIDNMIKGAAGQAIQNMNIALSLPEITGLPLVSPSF